MFLCVLYALSGLDDFFVINQVCLVDIIYVLNSYSPRVYRCDIGLILLIRQRDEQRHDPISKLVPIQFCFIKFPCVGASITLCSKKVKKHISIRLPILRSRFYVFFQISYNIQNFCLDYWTRIISE